LRRTEVANPEEHIRQLIEQIIFTVPGERVNRPTFGSGLLQMLFAPNSSEESAAAKNSIRSSLTKYLSDLITVEEVDISIDNSSIAVTVTYIIIKTQLKQIESFWRHI
jgi:phage baseplate assembly protein W